MPANANSPATISPVGPPPATTTSCSFSAPMRSSELTKRVCSKPTADTYSEIAEGPFADAGDDAFPTDHDPCGQSMTESMARRLFEVVEPVAVVTYMADESTEAVMALGAGNVWDPYFAGRAARWAAMYRPRWSTPCSTASPTARSPVASRASGTGSLPRPPTQRANSAQWRRCAGFWGRPRRESGVARAGDTVINAGTRAPTEERALAHRPDGAAVARGQPAPRAPRRRPRRRARDRRHRRHGGARSAHALRRHASRTVRAGPAPARAQLPRSSMRCAPAASSRRWQAHRRRPTDQGTGRNAHRVLAAPDPW